ncbi:MAG: aminotransferase class V-fold PLP-dependent enzyme [Candidatus Woesearchaeota archaeon]
MMQKADFPFFEKNPNLLYLDSAATSLKPQVMIDAVQQYYTAQSVSVHRGLYPLAKKVTDEFEMARSIIAQAINARPEQIVFVPSVTYALTMLANNLACGKRVLLTDLEHHANLVCWLEQKKKGAHIDFLSLTQTFDVEYDVNKIKNASIISTTHVSNVTGTVVDVKRLRQFSPNATIIVDGAQAFGHMPVDVQELDCDFYVFSAHKSLGPTGLGMLYVKDPEALNPFVFGGNMVEQVTQKGATFVKAPHVFEAGTPAIAQVLGFAKSVAYLQEHSIERIHSYICGLTNFAKEQLSQIQGCTLYVHEQSPGILSFSVSGKHAQDIVTFLGERGVCVRSGHHCAMPLIEKICKEGTVRVSLHAYNTKEDIQLFCKYLQEVLQVI